MVQLSNRRLKKAEAIREAILRAAAGVFRSRGFGDTGMREIAEAAGLSPANLYYYFKSKADILFFCQDHSLDRMLAAATELTADGLDAPEQLRRAIGSHLLCTLDELDGAAAHTEVEALPPELHDKIVAKRDRYERLLRKMVADGVKSGAFRDLDAALMTRAILGACNWTTRWYRPGGKLSPDAIATEYADYLVKGLLK